jgi:hypothetical protein
MKSRARFPLSLCFAVALPFLSAHPAAAESIAFEHKNWSDLRGILNVFDAFKRACLDQPVTREVPEELLPEGYQIVDGGLHALGFETDGEPMSVTLSKTGDELEDFAAGEPFVEFGFPTDAAPNGECRVAWKRAWDYPEGVQNVMTGTAAVFDSWLSFHLKAVRVSRPSNGFSVAEFYSDVSDWAVPCFGGTWCRLNVLFESRLNEGIYLTMRRGAPPSTPGSEDE